MKVYVAAKFEDGERAREVMALLRGAGHIVTLDWTRNATLDSATAMADMWGVVGADALVLIVEKDLNYCGALVEMGIAIGCDKPVYVLGDQLDNRCIFMHLPSVHKGIQALL